MQIKKKWESLAKENQTPRLRIRDAVGQLQYSCAFVSFQFVYVLAYVSLHAFLRECIAIYVDWQGSA